MHHPVHPAATETLKRLFSSVGALVLTLLLATGLSGCVSSRLPAASASPWQPVDIHTKSNPLDLAFRDRKSTRLNSSHRLTSRMPSSA